MKVLGTVLAALVIPFALLNLFGGIIAGIWLAILGEWSAIFLGLLIAIVGAFAASLLLLPGLGLAAIGATAIERGNKLVGWFFVLLASPWTYVVIIAWEVAVFTLFGKRMSPENIIPMWLWSYGAATGVWSYMASKEQQSGDGGSAGIAAFAAQIAYIVLSASYLWLGLSLRQSIAAMAVPLILVLLLGIALAASSLRSYDSLLQEMPSGE